MSKKINSIQAKLNKAWKFAEAARVSAAWAMHAINEARSAIAQLDVPPNGGKAKKGGLASLDVPPNGGKASKSGAGKTKKAAPKQLDVPPNGGKRPAKKSSKKI